MLIRKGDLVQVIAGDDAGTNARVLRVLPDENKVVVEGVNKVYKHLKPSRRNPQGGRLSKEMPVAAANVLLYCSSCGRGRRVGKRITGDRKVRYCKKCGADLGPVGKARAKA
jgi:large subunit ribosomal protein L24